MAVNVLGTWHVLLAAEAASAGRVVYFSSGQVFGLADGERLPDYFPVDDEHPRRAMRPYGLSKCLAEDLCARCTARTGIPTIAHGRRGSGIPPWPAEGHQRMLLCAADIAATGPSLEMAARLTPSVPVREVARFAREPRRALFDCSEAARVLGWQPRYRWSGRGRDQDG